MNQSPIHNPHLEGEAFTWQAGSTGILLSHGFTATAAEVRPLAERLFAHGYTVAGPLLPGHYSTPTDLNHVRWQDWAQAFEDAYQGLTGLCERVYTGGESTGALLALYHALTHPEVAGLLLYAPALKLTLKRYQTAVLHILAPFKESFTKSGVNSSPLWQGYTVNPLKGVQQLMRLQRIVADRLTAIHQPVLIMQSKLDGTIHPGVPEMIAHHISSATKEIHWLERSSHTCILDCELDEIESTTLRFLQNTSPAPA